MRPCYVNKFMNRKKNIEMEDEIPVETIAETENYTVWISEEPDGEIAYHVELGAVTLHFFREEWQELRKLITEAIKADDEA